MDRYTRVKKIGEGSFGMAVLVRSKENGQQYVVKEINMVKMGKKEREEARKETAVLAQLKHPNVVTYRESFEETGNLFIVMDYCEGGDLYGRINQQRGILFQEDIVLDWFVQICLSIKHIHDRKILHRDIKSQNIFLTKRGIVKLGDFGIAKVLNSTVELARTCIGTPYYLSPEICENKPYNNKSDIWSLGCVLYELTTLKHAFEAGNMKNLVLKIIRGSYPPVPSKYSYELRSLIAQLFKRSARDRPSVNAVLRKPILQARIQKFLTDAEVAEEFSHTILHGRNLRKALPPGQNRPQPVRALHDAVRKPPPPPAATPRYDPASVYGVSVSRRSKDKPAARKSGEARRSSEARKSADAKRPSSPYQADLARKRQELVDKENARKEAAKKKEAQYAKAHRELVDKQKVNRINRAREEGWKNLLSSDESDKRAPVEPRHRAPSPHLLNFPKPVTPAPAAQANLPLKDRGNYDQYHAWLDKMDQDRKSAAGAAAGAADVPGRGVPPAAGFDPGAVARQAEAASKKAAEAAERARVLEEFWQRKREAARLKHRGQGAAAGAAVSPRYYTPAPKPAPAPSVVHKPPPGAKQPSSARENHRRQQEEEYLARLRQIRLQNFNERRNIQEQLKAKADAKYKPPVDPDAENRKKKIEALRAQADERAQRLKADLEKKRYPEKQPKLPEHRAVRADPPKPVPAVPMTDAMKAIGAAPQSPPPSADKQAIGMTAAMEAIGVKDKSPLEKKKEQILKRLNSKSDAPSPRAKWGEAVNPDEVVQERPKWGEGIKPAEIAQERPKWGGAGAVALGNISLEETASHMDATSAADVVVRHLPGDVRRQEDSAAEPEVVSARKQWGGPAGTVLNALKGAELMSGGESTLGVTGAAPGEAPTAGGGKAPAIGSTITIGKGAKGTVVIKKAESSKPKSEIARNPATIEESNSETESAAVETSTKPTPSAGGGSSLFERVELDEVEADEGAKKAEDGTHLEDVEDEGDDGEDTTDSEKAAIQPNKFKKSVLLGLTTGHFDIGDVKLLRTCSEPDLAKLFKTINQATSVLLCSGEAGVDDRISTSLDEAALQDMRNEESDSEAANSEDNTGSTDEADKQLNGDKSDGEVDMDGHSEGEVVTGGEDDQDDADEMMADTKSSGGGTSKSGTSKSGDTSEAQDEDDDNEEDDEDDMETLRQSMMDLLEKDDPEEVEDAVPIKKKTTRKGAKKEKTKTKKKRKSKMEEKGDGDGSRQVVQKMVDSASEEDLRTIRETLKTLLRDPKEDTNSSKLKKAAAEVGSGDAPESSKPSSDQGQLGSTLVQGTEIWDSDSGSDGEDDFFEEDDMFSRLEATRALLETELGCDTFVKVYKTVQALHEDEDENMEEGISLVTNILGQSKCHLYPSILQLVMADGAFTEGND